MKSLLSFILCVMATTATGWAQSDQKNTNGETNAVTAIAMSADSLLAEAGSDGTIRIYDRNRAGAAMQQNLAVNGAPVVAMSFCESNLLVAVSRDGTVKMWDAVSGRMVRAARLGLEKKPIAVLAPGRKPLLAEAESREVRFWNYETGERIHDFEVNDSGVAAMAFTPDGQLLVIGSVKGVVRVMDVAAWKVKRMIDLDTPIYSIAASLKRIAVGYGDGSVAVLSMSDEDSVPEVKRQTQAIGALAFSPSGDAFASSSADGSVKIWDSGTLKLLGSMDGNGSGAPAIVFSRDGRWVFSCRTFGDVNYWSLPARHGVGGKQTIFQMLKKDGKFAGF